MRLISQEGHVFVVERRAACVSKLIETMLSSGVCAPCFAHDASPHLAGAFVADGFEEARHGAITFQEVRPARLHSANTGHANHRRAHRRSRRLCSRKFASTSITSCAVTKPSSAALKRCQSSLSRQTSSYHCSWCASWSAHSAWLAK